MKTPTKTLTALADFLASNADRQDDTLLIFNDGLVVTVWCSDDRHLTIRSKLKQFGRFEEAKVANFSMFLLWIDVTSILDQEGNPSHDTGELGAILTLLTDGYADHRQEPIGTIHGLIANVDESYLGSIAGMGFKCDELIAWLRRKPSQLPVYIGGHRIDNTADLWQESVEEAIEWFEGQKGEWAKRKEGETAIVPTGDGHWNPVVRAVVVEEEHLILIVDDMVEFSDEE
jgi:hypothetical protein